ENRLARGEQFLGCGDDSGCRLPLAVNRLTIPATGATFAIARHTHTTQRACVVGGDRRRRQATSLPVALGICKSLRPPLSTEARWPPPRRAPRRCASRVGRSR